MQCRAARRTYLIVTLIITIFTLIFAAYYISEKKDSLIKDKELYLLGIAANLDRQFDKKEFYLEVTRLNALPLSQDEKAIILNKWLQPLLMKLSMQYPECGLGIYAKELERIVAIGPYFETQLLRKVTRAEALQIYETQQPVFTQFTGSTGWHGKTILNFAYPIVYDDKVIGHAWASLKAEDVDGEIRGLYIKLIIYAVSLWLISMLILYLVFYRLHSALHHLAVQIGRQDDNRDSFRSFPELFPILDTIIELRQILKEEYQQNDDISAELVNSKNTITEILDGIDDSFYVLDQDNIVIYANKATTKMLQKEAIDVVGKNIDRVFSAQQQQEDITYGAKVRQLNTPLYNEVYVSVVDIWFGKKTYPLANGCIAIYLRDITENKKIERQLARLDQLNLVGQIAAGISHEIRNPMTTVRGYLQWLSKKECFRYYSSQFELMVAELDRANCIISEFLSVAKDKEITIEENNLNRIIESILPLLESDARLANKNIITNLQEIPDLLLDENEMKQLTLNLVRNALEASDRGQSVTIRTDVDKEQVYLQVSDQGTGIPPQIFAKIGTPFLTTKEHGTGLGLPVCYGIASRHNAKIDVKSTDKGTTFKISFPIAPLK